MTFFNIVENDVNPYYLKIGIVTPFLQIKFYLKLFETFFSVIFQIYVTYYI